MAEPELVVLIVEDGDEYLANLSRFLTGPRYRQAHNGREALDLLGREPVDLLYLDMRFDRIPLSDLWGDHSHALRLCNGDPARAWRYLQNHQGLFILDGLAGAGYGGLPTIISYDFGREDGRFALLRQRHPRLGWAADTASPAAIRELMARLWACRKTNR